MLSVSNLVKVTVDLSPQAAAGRSFGVLMIAGDSNVISGLERFRTYTDINSVATDFGTTAPEYLAASLYFGQSPQPSTCMIGRYIRTASAGQNLGGILSPSQQAIANFNAISNGGFNITVDGVAKTLTGINFNGLTNLNAVATAINGVLTGATVAWNGSEFIVTSNSTGAGVKASGTITLGTNPAPSDTLTVDGTLITFVASGPTGPQVLIGADNLATAANLWSFLNSSVDANISLATYVLSGGDLITVTYKTIGTAGNSFTLAKSSTHISLSGATLAGGAAASSVSFATTGGGTDISALLKLTSSTAIALVPGYAAETPVQCTEALADASTAWYGLMFAASVAPTDNQSLEVSAFIEALDVSRLYGVTVIDPNILSALVTNDLPSVMMADEYEQSFCQYSSTNLYAVASIFGRMFSVDFTAANSTITVMYKQEPGVLPEDLSQQEADVLESKRCNVYVEYDNATNIIQYGVCSGPAYLDEIHGLDWFQSAVQTACFNVLYTSTTKIPQTDAGVNQLTNACGQACSAAVNNGLSAPGVWNGPSFGSLQMGQYLKSGFYVFAPSVDLQSQADREARKAPPIQIALKLAGAIQSVDVLITVNR